MALPQSPLKRPGLERLVPLCDMSGDDSYKGEDGGLYGDGLNDPPADHLRAALDAAARIQPLDARGRASCEGRIALLSVGPSNAERAFDGFVLLAARDSRVSSSIVLVNGAQNRIDASAWGPSGRRFQRANPWPIVDRRLARAGVDPRQVQVVWMKHACARPSDSGEFPQHALKLKNHLVGAVGELMSRFPNLRIAYLSSRIYAGYALTALNPEPYAYEGAFAVRWIIRDQIRRTGILNHDPRRGPVRAPVLLWGPYLWARGLEGRKLDDLVWHRRDLAADGTHPSDYGRRKVAELLLGFFKIHPTARGWFLGEAG